MATLQDRLPTALRKLEALLARLPDSVAAQPEDQLKGPVQEVLGAVGAALRQRVDCRTEVRVAEVRGRPDVGVLVGDLLCGFVELKAPGKGARVERFKGSDRQQWDKFMSLPNLIYTDGDEWALYRSGERVGGVVRLEEEPEVGEGKSPLTNLVRDFLLWAPNVPSSPKALAQLLAPLCHLLREDVLEALREPGSAVRQVAAEWREALFPEADERQFADAYAQTITYSLLLARFEGDKQGGTDSAERLLRRKHGLLAQCLRILADPQARGEIELGVTLLERSISALDLAALRNRSDDPWLYFYEDFLSYYDPKLRNDRGVYYTPAEVIRCQCRLVAELLRRRFAKPLAFADSGVTVLDPGCGTGAYLLSAFQMGCDGVTERQGEGAVAGRAAEMARNLHGFEILVGPYAVAHLRLTQAILAAGGELPADGAHVYLADTLESPYSETLSRLPLQHKPLADEHRRARTVKLETPILVCLGNPPYDRQQIEIGDTASERKGGWVRFGEHGSDAILNDFLRPAKEAGQSVHLKNLYNDYVYFWRWALWKVFEEKRDSKGGTIQPASPGIVSFITASSYLRGPGFLGMRRVMRETFDELWIVDLEGDNLGARKTENVFAIRTPVAIAVGVRYAKPHPKKPAKVFYSRVEGTREAKLTQLGAFGGFADLDWRNCPDDWSAPFLPIGAGDFFSWPLLSDLFPWQHSGSQWKRTWPIGETKEVLRERWRVFCDAPEETKARLFKETRDRSIRRQYPDLHGDESPPPAIVGLPANARAPEIQRYCYRSFDRQWVLADSRLGDFLRPVLWRTFSDRQVYLTSLLSGVLGLGPAATVAAYVPDLDHFRGSFGAKHVIPLYRDRAASRANVTRGLLPTLREILGREVSAEDLFAYCYAVLAGPAYVERFSEELTNPGPRIPLTRDVRLFNRFVRLGRRLIQLHTYGERFSGRRQTAIPRGRARCTQAMPTRSDAYPQRLSYDAATGTLRVGEGAFAPVSPAVWQLEVSGLEVVKSWLSYRMKAGAGRRSSPLDAIRPQRWTAEMTDELLQLLWVLEATVALYPDLGRALDEIVESPVVTAAELPQPSADQRRPPEEEDDDELPLLR